MGQHGPPFADTGHSLQTPFQPRNLNVSAISTAVNVKVEPRIKTEPGDFASTGTQSGDFAPLVELDPALPPLLELQSHGFSTEDAILLEGSP